MKIIINISDTLLKEVFKIEKERNISKIVEKGLTLLIDRLKKQKDNFYK